MSQPLCVFKNHLGWAGTWAGAGTGHWVGFLGFVWLLLCKDLHGNSCLIHVGLGLDVEECAACRGLGLALLAGRFCQRAPS